MDYTAQIAAMNGTYTVTGVVKVDKNAIAIYVSTDTVFANLEINAVVADVRTSYFDVAAGTIPAGTLIVAGKGNLNYFSSATLTSGSITFILK